MDLDLIARPLLIQNLVQFLHELGPLLITLLGRQYPIVEFSHVRAQLDLLIRSEKLLGG